MPERPHEPAMSGFLSECRRGNGKHWALGMCQAVAAHLAGDHPDQRTTTARTHDQQVTRVTGHMDQDPASRAPIYQRPHQWIVRDFSPGCNERSPEPLASSFSPDIR